MFKTSIIKSFISTANIVTMAQMKNICWPTTMGMFTNLGQQQQVQQQVLVAGAPLVGPIPMEDS